MRSIIGHSWKGGFSTLVPEPEVKGSGADDGAKMTTEEYDAELLRMAGQVGAHDVSSLPGNSDTEVSPSKSSPISYLGGSGWSPIKSPVVSPIKSPHRIDLESACVPSIVGESDHDQQAEQEQASLGMRSPQKEMDHPSPVSPVEPYSLIRLTTSRRVNGSKYDLPVSRVTQYR